MACVARRTCRASRIARRSRARRTVTIATRSRPAAPASSARCICASSRSSAAQGFEFVDEVVGGAIPSQYIPAVEKGVRQMLTEGAIAGFPRAGPARHRLRRQASRGGFEGSRVRLRRPAGVPQRLPRCRPHRARTGRARRSHDAERRRPATSPATLRRGAGASAATQSLAGQRTRISALVPLAELTDYQSRVKSLTGGEGSYTMELSHYDPGAAAQTAGADEGVQDRRGRVSRPLPADPAPAPFAHPCAADFSPTYGFLNLYIT